ASNSCIRYIPSDLTCNKAHNRDCVWFWLYRFQDCKKIIQLSDIASLMDHFYENHSTSKMI
ncbi:MAG: hypothetical protein MK008_13350, partial [Bdellovibrionales bacterium]|nr:hypothetical protein [Bdellovibrionales bacterium]